MENPSHHQSPESAHHSEHPKFQSHRMALRALTMSLLLHGKKYISLHNSVEHLPDERKIQIQKIRTKRFVRRAAKLSHVRTSHEEHVHHAQELVSEMHDVLAKVDETRHRLYQQIEDTGNSGFTELSDHYAARLLCLESIGAQALTTLQETEENAVEVQLLSVLKSRIKHTRKALTEQLEWLPDMKELLFDEASQYQAIMRPA